MVALKVIKKNQYTSKRSYSNLSKIYPIRIQHGLMTDRNRVRNLTMYSYHAHPEVEINWVKQGSLEYMHGSKYYHLSAGQVGVFWGNYVHCLSKYSDDIDFYWITFPLSLMDYPNFLHNLRKNLLGGSFFVINELAHQLTDLYWKRISQSITTGGALRQVACLELQALLSRWSVENSIESLKSKEFEVISSSSFKKVNEILDLISKSFKNDLKIQNIADAVHINPQYMMRMFYKIMQVTVHDFILQFRIDNAKRLLLTSDLKVVDVAEECGFSSLSAFYAAFHKANSMSPIQFRKIQKNYFQ